MARREIFRKRALDRAGSPERLDLLHGVRPRRLGLVGLAAVACALVVVLWWLVDVVGAR